MGTPIPLMSRERECIGADPRINERKLTEEEIRHYNNLGKSGNRYYEEQVKGIAEMKKGPRPEKPSKEKLEEMLKPYPNKYRASYGVAKELGVSHATIDNWIKVYGITGIWRQPEEAMQKAELESSNVTPETDTKEFDQVIEKQPWEEALIHATNIKDNPDIHSTNQPEQGIGAQMPTDESDRDTSRVPPVNGIVPRLHYCNYDVGTVLVEVDFIEEKLRIGESKEMTFEEAAAVVELLTDIL